MVGMIYASLRLLAIALALLHGVVPRYDGTCDLKSEAVCMQEREMFILAENGLCNGLSTLLANLII